MATNPKDVTQNTAPSSERSRSPSPSKSSSQSDEAKNAAPTESRVYIQWILPTRADNKTKDEREATTQFAPLFSSRRWSLTDTPPLTVRGPPMRSPACTNKGLRKRLTGGVNKGSTCLMRLFNRISEETHAPADTSIYSRTAFDGAFRDDFAIVASESSANPIVTLDGDYDVTVTLRHEDREHENATIRFIRRPPPGSASDQHEYFITAPSQSRLTINGQTYIAEEGQQLVVGPLRGLSIVELLSQPIFFYRNAEDLNISTATGIRASAGERKSRDKNGDINGEQVDVTWTPVEAEGSPTAPSSPSNSPPGSPSNPGEAAIRAAEEAAAQIAAEEVAAALRAAEEEAAAQIAAEEDAAALRAAKEAADQKAAEEAAAKKAAEEAAKRAAEELAAQKAAKNKQADPKGKQKETSNKLQDELNPCEAMRRRLDELRAEEDTRLNALRASNIVEDNAGTWLQDEDIVMAIASITLAITNQQPPYEGFCVTTVPPILPPMYGETLHQTPTPGFGRSLLFPIVHADHTVLALVQMNENVPTFSILDSRYTHYNQGNRQIIFDRMMIAVQQTSWWRNLYDSWEDVPWPRTAHWIPCAQQPGDNECGYYTILNAWALALGLELNPHAAPVWNRAASGDGNIYQTILDIAHLARLGRVDWELIYNFLRCHRFVLDGVVPPNRRFPRSVPLQGVRELTDEVDRLLYDIETIYWSDNSNGHQIDGIRRSNFIRLPSGLAHTAQPPDFPSTGLREGEVRRRGHLRFGMKQADLNCLSDYYSRKDWTKSAGKIVGHVQSRSFLRSLTHTEGATRDASHERTFTWYREFLANKRSHNNDVNRWENSPCSIAGEGLGRLEDLLHVAHITDNLANAIPQSLKGQALDVGEVNLAIAAVVEAIDRHQVVLHRNTRRPFTGGFALTTSNNVQSAMGASQGSIAGGLVSRPRRCLLMPMIVTSLDTQALRGEQLDYNRIRGHHFLAVVQEEARENRTQFRMYTLDSAPERFRDADIQRMIYGKIRGAATNLGWSRQQDRIASGGFRQLQHTQVPVFQQRPGGWQCGLHTILNAWILALGLTPSTRSVNLNDEFYDELWVLVRSATAGLLDWRTLVAWLFCRQITTSRTLASVPRDRRFELSIYQEGEGDLAHRIGEIFETEQVTVATETEAELPYDHDNNIPFSRFNVDNLGLLPGSRAYDILRQCSADLVMEYGMATSLAERRSLEMEFEIKILEETMEAEFPKDTELVEESTSDTEMEEEFPSNTDEALFRIIENCGVLQRGTLKRKAASYSEWSHSRGDFVSLRKRYRLK